MKKWLKSLVLLGAMASSFALACDPVPDGTSSCGTCPGPKTQTVIVNFHLDRIAR